MKKIFALIIAPVLTLLASVRANGVVVSPYSESFDDVTADYYWSVRPDQWGRHVEELVGYDGSTYYVTYNVYSSGGVDDGAYISVGSQYLSDDLGIFTSDATDLLVTPRVWGTVTIYVKKNSSSGSLRLFNSTYGRVNYGDGSEMEFSLPEEVNTETWTQVTLGTFDEPTLIGLRCDNVSIDLFEAESMRTNEEIQLNSAAPTSSMFDPDDDGNFTLKSTVNVTNTGIAEITAGSEVLSLTLQTADGEDIQTKTTTMPSTIAGGVTADVEVSASFPLTITETTDYSFYVTESLTGTTVSGGTFGVYPYTIDFGMICDGEEVADGATIDLGMGQSTVITKDLTVSNDGGKPMEITVAVGDGFTFSATDADGTAIATDATSGEITVATHSSVTLSVTVDATTYGERSGTLTISCADFDADKTYTLAGNNVDPSKNWINFDSGTFPQGSYFAPGGKTDYSVNWRIINGNDSRRGKCAYDYSGSNRRFVLPKMSFEEGETLSFDVADWSANLVGTLTVSYSTDRDSGWTTLYSGSPGSSAWTAVSVAIPTAGDYYISFVSSNINIDNIIGGTLLTDEIKDFDLKTTIYPPASTMTVNYATSLNVIVSNIGGVVSAERVKVKATFGGAVICEETMNASDMACGENVGKTIEFTPHATGSQTLTVEVIDTTDGTTISTNEYTFTVSEESSTNVKQVGDVEGFISNMAPIRSFTKVEATKVIYLPEEIGLAAGAKITRLQFKGYYTADMDLSCLTGIYLFNTSNANASESVSVDNMYQATNNYTIKFAEGGAGSESEPVTILDVEFPADNPFVYTGQNIAVITSMIYDKSQSELRRTEDGVNKYTLNAYFESFAATSRSWVEGYYYTDDPGYTTPDQMLRYYYSIGYGYNRAWSSADGYYQNSYLPVAYFYASEGDAATLSGTVSGTDGTAVAGATVTISGGDDVVYSTTTDADGVYSITVYRSGLDYTMSVASNNEFYDDYTDTETFNLNGAALEKNVTLNRKDEIRIDAAEFPETVLVGNELTATVTGYNLIAKEAGSYTGTLYVDGEAVATTEAVALEAKSTNEFTFSYTAPTTSGEITAYALFVAGEKTTSTDTVSIRVVDNVMLEAFDAPSAAMVNHAITVKATVANYVDIDTGGYTGTFYVGGEAIATVTSEAHTAYTTKVYTASYVPHATGDLTANVVFTAGDMTLASETVTISVVDEVALDEVQAGDVTTTATTGGPVDLGSKASMTETIYTSDMLSLTAGDDIRGVRYKGRATVPDGADDSNFRVEAWISNETSSDFKGYDTEGMTQIAGTAYVVESTAADGTSEVIFDFAIPEGFAYDGGYIRILAAAVGTPATGTTVEFESTSATGISRIKTGDTTSLDDLSSVEWAEQNAPVAYFVKMVESKTLSGKVTTGSGDAISRATLTLTSGDVVYTGTSAEDGSYSIAVPQSSLDYELTVSATNYESRTETINLGGADLTKDFALSLRIAEGILLDAVDFPAAGMVNYAMTVRATVTNNVEVAAGGYTGTFYVGDEEVATVASDALDARTTKIYSFSYTPHSTGDLAVSVVFTADGTSATASATVSAVAEVVIEETQAGEATTTSTGGPVDLSSKASMTETIYTPDMMTVLSEGDDIRGVRYKGRATVPDGADDSNFRIEAWISNETSADFKGYDTEGMTQIAGTAYVVEPTATDGTSEVIFDFAIPEGFAYDGGYIRILAAAVGTPADGTTVEFESTSATGISRIKTGDATSLDDLSSVEWTAQTAPVAYFERKAVEKTMSGTVKTTMGNTVAGATLTLTSGEVVYTGTSADDGTYSITVLQSALDYTLTVSESTCEAYEETINLGGKDLTKDVTLTKLSVITLDAVTFPASGTVNSEMTVTATVANYAAFADGVYSVSLLVDGEAVDTQAVAALDEDSSADYAFSYTPHTAGSVTATVELTTADGETAGIETADISIAQETRSGTELQICEASAESYSMSLFSNGPITLNTQSIVGFIYPAEYIDLPEGAEITHIRFRARLSYSYSEAMHYDIEMYLTNQDDLDFGNFMGYVDREEKMTKITPDGYGITVNACDDSEMRTFIDFEFDEPFVYTGGNLRFLSTAITSSSHSIRQGYFEGYNPYSEYGYNLQRCAYNNNSSIKSIEEYYNYCSSEYERLGDLYLYKYANIPVAYVTYRDPDTGRVVTGTVMNVKGEAVSGAEIELSSSDNNVEYYGTSGTDGSYSIEVIQTGLTYDNLTASAKGYVDHAESDLAISVAEGSVSGKNITLTPKTGVFTVSGTARYGSTGVEGLTIALVDDGETVATTQTDENGEYEFTSQTLDYPSAWTVELVGTYYAAEAVALDLDAAVGGKITADITLDQASSVDTVQAGRFSVTGGKGCIVVTASKPGRVSVYNSAGVLLREAVVEAGVSVLRDIVPGFYVVNTEKVAVR